MQQKHLLTACEAMAVRFEIFIPQRPTASLRAIAEEALREIREVEQWLSPFLPGSEVYAVNACASQNPVKVTPLLYSLLMQCNAYSQQTNGSFDITVGPLMQLWGFRSANSSMPSQNDVEKCLLKTGMRHIVLNERDSTVYFDCPDMKLDFGAIGKGYALQRAANILRSHMIDAALLHGGSSSITAIGCPLNEAGWKIPLSTPLCSQPQVYALLTNTSLSVSALHGRYINTSEGSYAHIIHPATGRPVSHTLTAAVITDLAEKAEAFSTSLLAEGAAMHAALLQQGAIGLLTQNPAGRIEISGNGFHLTS